MSRPLTFERRLGRISFRHADRVFSAQIADSTVIVDSTHQRSFDDALAWVSFLKAKYPVAQDRPVMATVHEYVQTLAKEPRPPVKRGGFWMGDADDDDDGENDPRGWYDDLLGLSVHRRQADLLRQYGF